MKRTLLLWLSSLLVLSVQAQQGFRLGLTVQPQASFHLNTDFYKSGRLTLYGPQPNYFGQDSIETRFTPGFGISARLGYQFNERHGFESGVMYSWQGQNWKVTNTTGTVNRHERFHLFKIPMLYRFNTAKEGKKWQFLLNAGIQVSVLGNASLFVDGNRLADPEPTLGGLGFRDYFKEASLDGVVGIGTVYSPAERWEITLMARSDISILDAEDQSYKLKTRGDTRFMTVGLNIGFNYILIPRSKTPAVPPNVEVVPAN